MAEAVCIDLPAAGDEPSNLPFADSAADVQVLDGEIEHPRPASVAQRGERGVRDTSVSVVERHDHGPGRKRPATVPVVPDRAERHRRVSMACQPAHLADEICVRDVELGKRGAGRRVSQDVVHEDRDRGCLGQPQAAAFAAPATSRAGRLTSRASLAAAGRGTVEPFEHCANAKLAAIAAPTAGIAKAARLLAVRRVRALDMARTVGGASNRPPTARLTGHQQKWLERALSRLAFNPSAERLPEEGDVCSTDTGTTEPRFS